jgi:hypothetical protein
VSTDGIEGVFMETHNWGRAAKFYQALGFELDFTTDDGSAMLRHRTGPYLVLVEVPADRDPRTQLVLTVGDEQEFRPDPVIDVVSGFTDTHWGMREMTVRDPDGRLWSLQAPGKE